METQWKENGKNMQNERGECSELQERSFKLLTFFFFFWLQVEITGQLYTFWNEVYLFKAQIWPPKGQNLDFYQPKQ